MEVAEAHLNRDHAVDAVFDLAEELEAVLIVLGSRGVGPVDRQALLRKYRSLEGPARHRKYGSLPYEVVLASSARDRLGTNSMQQAPCGEENTIVRQ